MTLKLVFLIMLNIFLFINSSSINWDLISLLPMCTNYSINVKPLKRK